MTRGHKNALTNLTAEYLRSILSYNKKNGVFTWKITLSKRRSAGSVAGFKNEGRIKIGIDNNDYMAHRLAWLYIKGEWPEFEIDHKDGNKANNKWGNLRHATSSQNQRHKGIQANNKTGYKGVCFDNKRQKFLATINKTVNGKKKHFHIGHYNTSQEASEAYIIAAKKIHGKAWAKF